MSPNQETVEDLVQAPCVCCQASKCRCDIRIISGRDSGAGQWHSFHCTFHRCEVRDGFSLS